MNVKTVVIVNDFNYVQGGASQNEALKEKNIKAIIRWPFDMAARVFGMKVGKL